MVGSYNRNATAICFCFIFGADGLRTSRSHTHNGTTTTWEYVYNGSQLTQMKKGSDTLHFTYDASGTPTTVTHNGTVYYYVTNHQGDVVQIVSATGTTVATYTYDAWGNPTSTPTGTVATLNPLRYRGYVYDPETELYYLQSRYYNPEIGRFINADGLVSTGQGFVGHNMFAYCGNNPVNLKDTTGQSWFAALVVAVVVVSTVVLTGCSASERRSQHISELKNAPDLDITSAPACSYNCLGNALKKQIDTSPFGFSQGDSAEVTFDAIKSELGESNVRRLDSINDTIGPDEYMVALRCGPSDYHFVRRDENGWYNKFGLEEGDYVDESFFAADEWRFEKEQEGFGHLKSAIYYDGPIIFFAIKEGWDLQ